MSLQKIILTGAIALIGMNTAALAQGDDAGDDEAAANEPANVTVFAAAGEGTKSRHLRRANSSIKKAIRRNKNVTWQKKAPKGDKEAVECSRDLQCASQAAKELSAEWIVTAVLTTERHRKFTLELKAFDVNGARELSSTSIEFSKSKLRSVPGKELKTFIESVKFEPEPKPAGPVATPMTGDEAAKAAFNTEKEVVGAESTEDIAAKDGDESPLPEVAPTPEPEPTKSVSETPAQPTIYVGASAGVFLPQLSSELSTTVGGKLDVGYRLWSSLTVLAAASYAQPATSFSGMDARFPSSYETSTTQRELQMTLGAMWRFLPHTSSINVYAGAGARVYMLETKTNGSSGMSNFLEYKETSTKFGGAAFAGAEYGLGPGALVGELDFGASDLGHVITGDVSTTAFFVSAGYRFGF